MRRLNKLGMHEMKNEWYTNIKGSYQHCFKCQHDEQNNRESWVSKQFSPGPLSKPQ